MRLALYKGSLAKCIMQNLCQLANNMHEKRNLKFVLLTVPRCGRLAVMDPPPPPLSLPQTYRRLGLKYQRTRIYPLNNSLYYELFSYSGHQNLLPMVIAVVDRTLGTIRSEYEYEIEYECDCQISDHSHLELSLLPVIYQQIRRPSKQDWCEQKVSRGLPLSVTF